MSAPDECRNGCTFDRTLGWRVPGHGSCPEHETAAPIPCSLCGWDVTLAGGVPSDVVQAHMQDFHALGAAAALAEVGRTLAGHGGSR